MVSWGAARLASGAGSQERECSARPPLCSVQLSEYAPYCGSPFFSPRPLRTSSAGSGSPGVLLRLSAPLPACRGPGLGPGSGSFCAVSGDPARGGLASEPAPNLGLGGTQRSQPPSWFRRSSRGRHPQLRIRSCSFQGDLRGPGARANI
ncbi:hypothetical protein NDU88_003059 [Pleurodeles waltl]|uniref:Uncharacterized protein n=1 Tax=Pleurodeles waltl TaxID=8319 RepID=A0AAV7PH55_PLEWA|nr:hypothetical protein NDU88_003059 [Pleurodeles waltl]